MSSLHSISFVDIKTSVIVVSTNTEKILFDSLIYSHLFRERLNTQFGNE